MKEKNTQTIPPAMNQTIVDNIKHVVVLMMENRSFDHIFGDFPGVNGINPTSDFFNYRCPTDPECSSTKFSPYSVTTDTQPKGFGAAHDFNSMMQDIFGPGCDGCTDGKGLNVPSDLCPPQSMCGFVHTNPPAPNSNAAVMSYFKYLSEGTPGRLNVLHTLAENFVVCDNWFCDTPSETVPNRLFMHAATNMGNNDTDYWPGPINSNPDIDETKLYDASTIYSQLDKINPNTTQPNWAMYGFPKDEYDSGMFAYTTATALLPQANRSIFDFPIDVLTNNLPFYSFIMPSLLFGGENANGNSMHPDGDIRLGENLVASVYNVLRNSPLWENTLLIVTFDENGGIYDHVTPASATPPDSITYPVDRNGNPTPNPLFDYSILGPRIPVLLVSPWLANPKSGQPPFQIDSAQYQNTSILKFLQDLFQAQNGSNPTPYINNRDASANSFADSSYWRESLGVNCPQSISPYSGFPNWGTELTDPNGDDPSSGPSIGSINMIPPSASALDFAKEYCRFYPGHADSGKPLSREFMTHAELIDYMLERRKAAREFYEKRKKA